MKKLPQDYYFEAFSSEDDFGIASVVLTSKKFWDKNGYWDDSLGSHNINKEVKKALTNAGVHAESELMESVWEVINPDSTKEEIIENMKREGFIHNEKMGI